MLALWSSYNQGEGRFTMLSNAFLRKPTFEWEISSKIVLLTFLNITSIKCCQFYNWYIQTTASNLHSKSWGKTINIWTGNVQFMIQKINIDFQKGKALRKEGEEIFKNTPHFGKKKLNLAESKIHFSTSRRKGAWIAFPWKLSRFEKLLPDDAGKEPWISSRRPQLLFAAHPVFGLQRSLEALQQVGFELRPAGVIHPVESHHSRCLVVGHCLKYGTAKLRKKNLDMIHKNPYPFTIQDDNKIQSLEEWQRGCDTNILGW